MKQYYENKALDDVTATNNFNTWFENNFIVGENYYCHHEIFSDKLKKAELGFIKAKDEFRRMKLDFKYESQLRLKQEDEGYYKAKAKGYWVGYKALDDVTETNNFNTWFENNFIVGENFHCHNEVFSDKLKKAELGFIKAKDEFRRMKLDFKYESQLRLKQEDEGYYKAKAKGYWIGFKCIDEITG